MSVSIKGLIICSASPGSQVCIFSVFGNRTVLSGCEGCRPGLLRDRQIRKAFPKSTLFDFAAHLLEIMPKFLSIFELIQSAKELSVQALSTSILTAGGF